MEAAEAKLQKVLEGSKQFLVPHYQRPYSWEPQQWQALWHDIAELVDDPEAKPHFLGSIVTSPARTMPEGVEKRLVIDGQQRLTTLLVLLTVIRDLARTSGASKLAERVQDVVTNRHEEGLELFKLLPTQAEDPADSDREAFVRVVSAATGGGASKSRIPAAYDWFAKKLRRADAPDLDVLHRVVTSKLTLVSIILDEKDNPHRIFESLNGKGRPLSQADLIRNYFFMRLPLGEHEAIYRDLWRPMQRRLGEDALTDFVRHFLTRFIGVVRESDVYSALKARVDENSAKPPGDHLRELARYSEYYEILLAPEKAPTQSLRDRLTRIQRLEVTVAYPFLLPVYGDFATERIDEASLRSILDVVENFVVRRFVSGVPTYGLNKVFAPLYEQARKDVDFVGAAKRILSASARGYPRDSEFRKHLTTARLYGAGERREKTKFILERLENAGGHKEAVVAASLTIEHVMPQTLTDAWKQELGPDWEEDHQQLLHTLGNLTLTSYNAELGNAPFGEKRELYVTSHVELNRYFAALGGWTAESIEQRAQALADVALATWPYFGREGEADALPADVDDISVAGTVPLSVRVRGEDRPVQSWVDVAVATIEAIAAMGDDELNRVVEELPKFVNWDPTAFRRSSRLRKLPNGVYVETNLSATSVYRLCLQAAELAGLVAEDWSVSYKQAAVDAEDEEETKGSSSALEELQLEFWTQARAALEKTGAFASLRPPPRRHWFVIALGRHGFHMSLSVTTKKARLAVKVVFRSEQAGREYESIAAQRDAIESEVGAALEWDPHPEKRWRTAKITHPFILHERNSWEDGVAWLTEHAVRVQRAFGGRIAQLAAEL